MISTHARASSPAAACTGSHGVSGSAASGALRTVMSWPTGGPVPIAPIPPIPAMARVMRQRRLAGPWSEHQGRSVFIGTNLLARKAEAHRRAATVNDGYVRNGDVWDPDPWRPHPV